MHELSQRCLLACTRVTLDMVVVRVCVGVHPDLGETDGRVKAEEYDHRYKQMADDAPR